MSNDSANVSATLIQIVQELTQKYLNVKRPSRRIRTVSGLGHVTCERDGRRRKKKDPSALTDPFLLCASSGRGSSSPGVVVAADSRRDRADAAGERGAA